MRNDLHSEWSDRNVSCFCDYSTFSNKKCWWVCNKKHHWEETIANRASKNTGCPFCSGRRACNENCLATVSPELSLQWHQTNKLSPLQVTAGTHKKYWWVCEKGHEWESAVVKRVRCGRGCPYCSNQMACEDNCISSIFPALMPEWHPTKNKRKPEETVYGSCAKVWWICNCGFSWEATPRKRTRQNTGCPVCKSSVGEKAVAAWLDHENVKFLPQHKFDGCKNKFSLPFDFYLEDYDYCIEFQGEQHYKPIPYFGGEDKLEKIRKRDDIKSQFCSNNNIKLLVIPYWKLKGVGVLLKDFLYA